MARRDESDPLAATAPASDSSTAGVAAVRGPQLAAGTQVGRYVIVEPLGSGGMGAVYAAKDPELGRRVAIKLLHPHLADMQTRLLREGQAIARLRHPNVVTIHDVGTHDGNLFIAMELVAGKTLRAWLETSRTWQEIAATFSAAGNGLAAAHAAGLVHRDFKPDNVLLGDDGSIVVTDFGLARTSSAQDGEEPKGARASQPQLVDITQSGAFVGTPAYMSPEQFRGDVVEARSDQFSFCVALYEALYGARPFAGTTLAGLQDSVLHGSIPARPVASRVPVSIHAAIERGLSRDPAKRFPSMDELLAALAPPRAKQHVWRYVAAGGVCVAAAITAFAMRGPKTDSCTNVTAAIDNVWTLDARAKSNSHDARIFDRFAQAWRADRTAACRAHTAKATQQAACLERAAVVFAQLVQRRPPDGDIPLPSLRRCARGDEQDAVARSVQKPAPPHAALSPDGNRFATLEDQRLTIQAMATGLPTETRDVPGAAALSRWTPSDVISMRDASGTRLLTLTLAAPGIETVTLPDAASFVSPDLTSAVVVSNGDVQLRALHGTSSPQVLGRLEPGRSVLAGAWSPDARRFALLVGPVTDSRVELYELPGPAVMELSFGGGPPISDILWHTNDRLLYSSRGIWSVDLPHGGVTGTSPSELPEPAERRVAPGDNGEQLRLLASNGTRVLARRIAATIELVRVRDGNKTVLPVNTDIIRVKGATSDMARIAIECENSVGIIDWHTKQYSEVGTAADVIAADGMRILLIDGNELLEVSDKGRRQVTVLPPSAERRSLTCAATGGTCAVLSWGRAMPELRVLRGDVLGAPIQPVLPYRIRDIALSPDGKRIAYAGGPATTLDTADLATGTQHALPWPSDPALCGATTLVAWPGDADGNTLYASQDCRGGLSRIVARAASGAGKTLFEGEGQITGFTPSGGDLYLDLRREDSELVVIDDI